MIWIIAGILVLGAVVTVVLGLRVWRSLRALLRQTGDSLDRLARGVDRLALPERS
ncbi:MAG: hypothetical protein LBM23_05740 [Propionibacteriaceae bacterium]|nr:hypothetical protein [Propionibacteriaceae bacterium]